MALSVRSVVCLVSLCLTITLSSADDGHGTDAVSYDKDTFQEAITEKKHFIMFFAPWCGHCKRLAPTWDSLARVFNTDESQVTIAKVDCTMQTALCADHEVAGYPTLKFFHKKGDHFQRYKGNRDLSSLQKFVEEQVSQTDEHGDYPPVPSEEEEKKDPVTLLTDESFDTAIQEGFHFVKFFAPWCGHCKKLAPTWEDLAKSFADSQHVTISMVDCTQSSRLCSTHGIKGYPTLILFHNGHKIDLYQSGRSHEELKSYVQRKVKEETGADFGGEQETVPEQRKEEGVVELTGDNFDEVVREGLTFVKFYAPWCGHCQHLAPVWGDLGKAFAGTEMTIARIDCDAKENRAVCSDQSVSGYPTLIMFQNGVLLDEYHEGRDLESLKKFTNKFLDRHTEL